MKIYFTASIIGKRYHLADYERIVALLKKGDGTVLADHILETSEAKIREESEFDRRKYHEHLKRWITESNCVIAETSYPSTGVGYEISYALSHGKPVLMLYKKETTPPSLFEQYSDELLICEAYTAENLPIIIEDFLSYVKGGHDRRFTFSLTPKIAAFLEHINQTQNIPKSVYIRQLLEDEMQKHSSE